MGSDDTEHLLIRKFLPPPKRSSPFSVFAAYNTPQSCPHESFRHTSKQKGPTPRKQQSRPETRIYHLQENTQTRFLAPAFSAPQLSPIQAQIAAPPHPHLRHTHNHPPTYYRSAHTKFTRPTHFSPIHTHSSTHIHSSILTHSPTYPHFFTHTYPPSTIFTHHPATAARSAPDPHLIPHPISPPPIPLTRLKPKHINIHPICVPSTDIVFPCQVYA